MYVVGGAGSAENPRRTASSMESGERCAGARLVAPRECADWLGNPPNVADYFPEHDDFVEANAETETFLNQPDFRPTGTYAFVRRNHFADTGRFPERV